MRPLIAALGLAIAAAPALAQDAGTSAGRYQITPSDEGFTRLDTETGSLSHCGKRDGVWHCEPLGGTEAGLEGKLAELSGQVDRLANNVDALAARIDALSARVDALAAERQGSPGLAAEEQARIDALAARVDALAAERQGPGPTAEEQARRNDEALNFAERVMRRFFDMVREMRQAAPDQI